MCREDKSEEIPLTTMNVKSQLKKDKAVFYYLLIFCKRDGSRLLFSLSTENSWWPAACFMLCDTKKVHSPPLLFKRAISNACKILASSV